MTQYGSDTAIGSYEHLIPARPAEYIPPSKMAYYFSSEGHEVDPDAFEKKQQGSLEKKMPSNPFSRHFERVDSQRLDELLELRL
jgi:hypothetical protein